jgi:hypothetical protein
MAVHEEQQSYTLLTSADMVYGAWSGSVQPTVEKFAETLGTTSVSKGRVSELAKSVDGAMEQFRSRFVQANAMTIWVREGGPTVLMHAVIAAVSTLMAGGRASAWTSPVSRIAPGDWRSSAAWSPAARTRLQPSEHAATPSTPARHPHAEPAGQQPTWAPFSRTQNCKVFPTRDTSGVEASPR